MGKRYLLRTRFMLELQKLLIKYSNKGVRLLLGSFPSSKFAGLCMEIVDEDWVRFQLGMHLQLGVLL